jgi:hypothetical protein
MLTDEKISELKQKHGALRKLSAEGHTIVIRRATEAEWAVFLGYSMDDRKRMDAMRTLLDKTVVHPEPAAFAAMVSGMPGLVQTFATQATEFNGFLDVKAVERVDL